ncbi:MAG: PaaI family thioesterase [Comamonadaceae bacterium]|nr:MAG: PaaI family thioesterase [Comamonadaceae bacterium]
MSDTPLSMEAVQAKLLRGPYHQWLGLTVEALGEGTITLKARWREEWVVNPDAGYCHGGILATLVDLTADWALVSKTGRGVPTVDLRVDYHRPALKGDLTCVGTVVKFGSQLSVAEAKIMDEKGVLLASGRGVYMTAPPKS